MESELAADTVRRVFEVAAQGAEIAAWTVVPEVYPAVTPSTGALERVVATTTDGRRVSVFVKTLQALRHWPMFESIPPDLREVAAGFPWRVEIGVYGSGLLDDLPDGLRAPRVFLIEELGDDRTRLWMEDVVAPPTEWDLARYEAAARSLGRLAGRFPVARLPADLPPLGVGLRDYMRLRIDSSTIPALRSEETWRHPLLQAAAAADPALRADLLALADDVPSILDALDALPHTLAHCDACPQNLLADPALVDGFVAIDWSFTTTVQVGFDLGQLIAGRAESGELDPADLPGVHAAIVPAYLLGIHEEGLDPDPVAVRLGYVGSLLVRSGFTGLPLELLARSDQRGIADLFARRARYTRFMLDRRREIGVG
jgi:hypothetical protein